MSDDASEEIPTEAEFFTAKALIAVRRAMIAQYKMTFALIQDDREGALDEAAKYLEADLQLFNYINELLKVEDHDE